MARGNGISQQSFYIWKKKYAGLGLNELRELRQFREENGKLKRLVTKLSREKRVLRDERRMYCFCTAEMPIRAILAISENVVSGKGEMT